MRKVNFSPIPIRGDTKEEIDKLKDKLKEEYDTATYDELIKIFLEKNRKITLSKDEIKRILGRSRGIT